MRHAHQARKEALAMAEEHRSLFPGDHFESDIFHCLKCGRIAYEPHGTSPPPACCEQPMIRAVTGVAKTGPVSADVEPPPEEIIDEYALLAEAIELTHWSRT